MNEDVEDVAGWIRAIAGKPSRWQKIIHGATECFRQRIALELLGSGCQKVAMRYAQCGQGDGVVEDGHGKFRMRPKRCGHRLCPRCARYRGSQRVRHVMEHLERGPHGSLWHLVMTQRVVRGEPVSETKRRFEALWRQWIRRFRRMGAVAGLRSTHCVWSRYGGWHYHAHFFMELPGLAADCWDTAEAMREAWCTLRDAKEGVKGDAGFCRLVVDQGDGLPRDESSQGEFWSDPSDDVARAVQYVVRDVCQSLEAWNLDSALDRISEFVDMAANAQFSRMYGWWRSTADQRFGIVEDSPGEESNEVKSFDESVREIGTVDSLMERARRASSEGISVMLWLRETLSARSVVGSRLRRELNWLTG